MNKKNDLIENVFGPAYGDGSGLSVRIWNALKNMNIKTIDDLKFFDDKKLLSIPNFGKKSLKELRSAMDLRGVEYHTELPKINVSVLTIGEILEDDNGVQFKLLAMSDGYCMVQATHQNRSVPVVITICTAIEMFKRAEFRKGR